jgi:transcription elongation factor GreA
MSTHPMTLNGKNELETELKNLMQAERPKVILAIEEARSHGDLSENADYDAAKERQGFIESRISDLKAKLAESQVVDTARLKSETVIFGAYVKLVDLESEEELNYQIVGMDEANVKNGKLSVFSPLARSIIGKKKGAQVEFQSPNGEKEYEILDLFFK